MQRRTLLLTSLAALLAGTSTARADVLRDVFNAQEMVLRRSIQVDLQLAELYTSEVDGLYGPGTRAALLQAAERVAAHPLGGEVFDLSRREDAERFISLMAAGVFSFLFDDGYEG